MPFHVYCDGKSAIIKPTREAAEEYIQDQAERIRPRLTIVLVRGPRTPQANGEEGQDARAV